MPSLRSAILIFLRKNGEDLRLISLSMESQSLLDRENYSVGKIIKLFLSTSYIMLRNEMVNTLLM